MQQVRGRPFEAGNKLGRGRPKGSRNKAGEAWQQLLKEHAESIYRKCILLAMQGEPHAMRLCMERIEPVRRDSYIRLKLPPIKTLEDVAAAVRITIKAVGAGTLTPADGEIVVGLLEGQRKIIETEGLQARIEKLENTLHQKNRGLTVVGQPLWRLWAGVHRARAGRGGP